MGTYTLDSWSPVLLSPLLDQYLLLIYYVLIASPAFCLWAHCVLPVALIIKCFLLNFIPKCISRPIVCTSFYLFLLRFLSSRARSSMPIFYVNYCIATLGTIIYFDGMSFIMWYRRQVPFCESIFARASRGEIISKKKVKRFGHFILKCAAAICSFTITIICIFFAHSVAVRDPKAVVTPSM